MTGNTRITLNRRKPAVRGNASRRSLDLLDDLTEITQAVLQDGHGLAESDALRAAEAITRQVRRHWGGQQLYFPRAEYQDAIDERDSQIVRAHDGTPESIAALAREHGLTERQIRYIITRYPDRPRRRQASSPPA